MTLLANMKWTCKCGHENTAQLWHSDEDKHGDEYINGKVPADCGMNWVDPCLSCGKYTLSDEEHEADAGLIGWKIVRLDDAERQNHRPALAGQVDFLVMRGVNEMKITKEMVKKALEAYAEKRHPSRWDGEPWGEAGRRNHEAAIRNALEVIFTDYKLIKKDEAKPEAIQTRIT